MDDDDLMGMNFMDLDLNQEPRESPLQRVARYGSLLNELEATHETIEQRIRQLEAVTARTRQRQRWRQARSSTEISNVLGEVMVDEGQRSVPNENRDMAAAETTAGRTAERGKGCKRDSSHLVAKALEMDSEVKKEADKEGGSFYDCNICLDVAREPVLTCCGHLFCWPCFYQVSNVDSTSKECPVCKGEVSDSSVIPVYGNGDSEPVCETDTGLKIPPRPKARRIESARQQRLTQGQSHVPVAEVLRRIRVSIGAMGNQTQEQEGGSRVLNYDTSQEGQNAESAGGHHIGIHQYSRVLSESAASLSSLSSLSSALSYAERLVEDFETVIHNRLLRNVARVDAGNVFSRPSFVIQSNNQPSDSTAEIDVALPITSSAQSTDVSSSILNLSRTGTSSNISFPVATHFRRRSTIRNSDLDSLDSRESRRRRLN